MEVYGNWELYSPFIPSPVKNKFGFMISVGRCTLIRQKHLYTVLMLSKCLTFVILKGLLRANAVVKILHIISIRFSWRYAQIRALVSIKRSLSLPTIFCSFDWNVHYIIIYIISYNDISRIEMQIVFVQFYGSGRNCTENGCASQIMQNSFLIMLCDFPDIRQVWFSYVFQS